MCDCDECGCIPTKEKAIAECLGFFYGILKNVNNALFGDYNLNYNNIYHKMRTA